MKEDIQVNNVRLKVWRKPGKTQKPTIVFLHDSLGCIRLWRDFPQKLGEVTGCSILVYDRQGYGGSAPFANVERQNDYLEKEADLLRDLLNKCGIHEAILFGHSDGGTIALIAAAKFASTVKAIITEGAHIFVEDLTLKGIRAAVQQYNSTDLRQKLQKYHGDKTEAVFQAWTRIWLKDSFRNWTIENFLPHIQCPSLIIQGKKDEFGTLQQVEGILDNVNGRAEKLIIPDVGHTPHREAEYVVLESALRFINSLDLPKE
ncbi:alpha/beta fold hydrolase [Roseivirga sp. BDSF3-8]|uniref:alpha/beta fold hydrolase n=1 Tax=Roseivirga sp. BDSF3-8 TaxID=3241598 RepID=UPI0035321CF3